MCYQMLVNEELLSGGRYEQEAHVSWRSALMDAASCAVLVCLVAYIDLRVKSDTSHSSLHNKHGW